VNEAQQHDLEQLVRAFSKGAHSRRDFMRVGAIATGAVATAAMLAACGGGDDDDNTNSTQTTVQTPGTTASPVASPTKSAAELTPTTVGQQTGQIQATTPAGDFLTGQDVTLPWKTFGIGVVIDPHRAPNWGPFWYLLPFAFSGLVQFDENAIVRPDLAESWDVSNGGLTYTFKIRQDAKFASGRDITADDFVYSWKRALDPKDGSPMLHFMEHLKGHKEFNEGTATELSGVRVIDDKTIELTLETPYNFFLSYLGTFVWYVVDRDAVEKFGTDFAQNNGGAGPWKITKVDPQLEVVMEPDPNYYGGVNPSIAKLTFTVLVGPTADTTALNLYKSDESVYTDVPISLLDAVEGDDKLKTDTLRIDPSGSIRSLWFNFKMPPFDDVRVRRAFGHAIDRETFSKQIWRETWVPATYYTPKVVLNSDPGYQPPADAAPEFDPEKGKQLLADAGFPNGQGLPEIRFYEASEDASDEINRWKAFLDMFKENLGVEIIHDTSLTADQMLSKNDEQGGFIMDVWWWGNITMTPQLMSEVMRTDSPYNLNHFNWQPDIPDKGGYTPGKDAAAFDELMKQADVEQDQDKMNELYRQGEELMLKNAVYMPIANQVPVLLVKPWIKNLRIGWWNFSAPSRIEPDGVVVKH